MTKQAEELELSLTQTGTIADHVKEILRLLGEDPSREGLRGTPERYEKALKFLNIRLKVNLSYQKMEPQKIKKKKNNGRFTYRMVIRKQTIY